ncbi:3619_t:CDS:2 [Paraglomus occultum]|uniref:3619_t:CDS:1 n=1 Tax=Paraglomus occultum TaxID=144539 RepID=A0A9N9CV28_9GLOM|nr:3619_t:CDS:2 [Paraglomus occultum]
MNTKNSALHTIETTLVQPQMVMGNTSCQSNIIYWEDKGAMQWGEEIEYRYWFCVILQEREALLVGLEGVLPYPEGAEDGRDSLMPSTIQARLPTLFNCYACIMDLARSDPLHRLHHNQTTHLAITVILMIVTDANPRKKRRRGEHENVTKVLKLDSPSSVAEHREFLKIQQNTVILNHRPPHCVGPPIFLYHEIFSKFLDDYTNEELELQTGHCAWTIELIEIMAKVYDVEILHLQAFRDHMTPLTGQFSVVENEDNSKSDGILQTITTSGQIGFRVIL